MDSSDYSDTKIVHPTRDTMSHESVLSRDRSRASMRRQNKRQSSRKCSGTGRERCAGNIHHVRKVAAPAPTNEVFIAEEWYSSSRSSSYAFVRTSSSHRRRGVGQNDQRADPHGRLAL